MVENDPEVLIKSIWVKSVILRLQVKGEISHLIKSNSAIKNKIPGSIICHH